MDTEIKIRRWPELLVGVLCMLVTGIIYAWSILKAPLAAEFKWTAAQLALNFTLTMCCFCFGGLVSGVLTRKFSPRLTLLIAALLCFLGFLLSSRLSGALFELYITYGVMCGLGVGMAYNAVIAAVGAWFPDKKGLCSGCLMMAFGASALVLGNIAGAMIGSSSIGWRSTYLGLGIVLGIVLLGTAFVVRFPPAGLQSRLPQPKQPSSPAKKTESFETRDYSAAEMLHRPSFWLFFVFNIAICAVGNTVISFARDLAINVGAAAELATTLVGVLSVCNGLGRIICGALFDSMGRKKTMLLECFLAIVAPGVTLLAVLSHSLLLGIVGLCLCGLCYGFSPTITSAFISNFYGLKNFAMNFGIANIQLVPASFIATLSAVLLSISGSYAAPFTLLVGLGVLGLVLNLCIRRP